MAPSRGTRRKGSDPVWRVDSLRGGRHSEKVGRGLRWARHRTRIVWLAVLVPVPLACLGGALFLAQLWSRNGPPIPWHPIFGWYLEFGTAPTVAAVVGWLATRSARRTIALAAAGFVAFFVWLIVYLLIDQWVTGVPIFPSDG
jgi:hypothetical protein